MRIEYNGKAYFLGWKYHYPMTKGCSKDPSRKKKNKPASKTTCKIWAGETLLTSTQIKLHSGDAPCKETARKASLKKALSLIAPGLEHKDFRAAVWKAYLCRPRITQLAVKETSDESLHAETV